MDGEFDPNLWVQLLWQYGPFALMIFLIAFVERRVWANWCNPHRPHGSKLLLGVIYTGVWLSFVGAGIFAMYYFGRTHLPGKVVINGTFENLNAKESVESTSPIYLRRSSLNNGPDHYDYRWWLIPDGPRPVDDITFTFSHLKRSPDGNLTPVVTDYNLPIEEDYYKGNEIRLLYDRKSGALVLKYGSTKTPLTGSDEIDTGFVPRVHILGGAMAWAGSAPSVQDISDRLDSDDVIIRRNARQELSRDGSMALPIITQVLESDRSSDRVKEGVLLALAYMHDPAGGNPSPELRDAVIKANAAPNQELRSAARHYLAAWASPEFENVLAAQRRAAIAAESAHAKPSPNSTEIALSELEVLYNLGVKEKDAYRNSVPNLSHFNAAVSDFQRAWDLERGVLPSERVFFAKALYGWGLALHDRSWLQRGQNNQRDPELIQGAQQKFRQFLAVVQSTGSVDAYPYPDHIKRAKLYLTDPSPKSLTIGLNKSDHFCYL